MILDEKLGSPATVALCKLEPGDHANCWSKLVEQILHVTITLFERMMQQSFAPFVKRKHGKVEPFVLFTRFGT